MVHSAYRVFERKHNYLQIKFCFEFKETTGQLESNAQKCKVKAMKNKLLNASIAHAAPTPRPSAATGVRRRQAYVDEVQRRR
jgi:hypothetical protein